MLIEHDGKTIDTEREIRHRLCHTPARYVGTLSSGDHLFEWGQGCWGFHTSALAVSKFENVPVTHERWVNVYHNIGYPTKEEADRHADSDRITCVRIEWQS